MTSLPGWTGLDDRAIAYARALAADAVQKVGNGHPGTAMSLAPVAYTLFQRHLVHDPSDPTWLGRDRFILSCGHSSLTLYTQLFYSGYGLEMEDLKSFRTWGSLTPGHPEFGHTAGVEMTTGPLGQGVATAVGMAMAARYERGLLDSDAPEGASPFDHSIWVICSDGDLQEGISAEASSLAGTQELGNLNLIYDDNRISIEGDTHNAFTEDVSMRYRAYGWHVVEVATLDDGSVDISALDAAMITAKSEKTKPTLISLLLSSMKSSTKAIQHATVVLASLFFVGACSTTIAGTATTIVPVGPTDFATIPPVQSTLPNIVTTLPIGAVGVEQIYTVRAGDSPSLVANLYGIMVAELLSWNGLVATSQFPFPGSILKIPPTATVNNPQINVAPDVAAGPSQPGCDPRPAGTYKVARGDSMYIIRRKFCVSLGSLLSANGFNSSGALLYPGQILNIPASGS